VSESENLKPEDYCQCCGSEPVKGLIMIDPNGMGKICEVCIEYLYFGLCKHRLGKSQGEKE